MCAPATAAAEAPGERVRLRVTAPRAVARLFRSTLASIRRCGSARAGHGATPG